MKTNSKILAIILCLCLLFSCVSISAFAAGTTAKGSITIQNPSHSSATVAGKTFLVFKVFNATTDATNTNTSYSWYTDENGDIPFYDFFYGTNGILGEYTGEGFGPVQAAINELANYESYSLTFSQLAENMHDYIVNNSIQPVKSETADPGVTSVTIGDLDYGYYLVYDDTDLTTEENKNAVRSAVMLTTVDKDWTITLKANRPQILKQVLENNGTYGKGTSVSIGDTVKFKISTAVPSRNHYPTYIYKIEDTMHNGLELIPESIVVSYDGQPLTKGVDYTMPATSGDVDFAVDFTDSMKRKQADNVTDFFEVNKTLSIEYSAKVTGQIQTTNQNSAELIYSNDPLKPEETTGRVSDTANVYSYQFVFTKFAQESNGTFRNVRLGGAEFKLYEEGSDTPIKFVTRTKELNIDGQTHSILEYVVAEADATQTTDTLVSYTEGDATITLGHLNYGGHKGDIAIFGLSEGNYKLVETKAPDGYVTPDAPFMVEIEDEIGAGGSVGALRVEGSHSGDARIINTLGIAESVLTVWADITNVPGATLPETGGMGTTIFTILGIILMVGAATFFTSRKRSSAV